MCGILAVLARRARRPVPDATAVVDGLAHALALLGAAGPDADALTEAARAAEAVGDELRGPPGVACLLQDGVGDQVGALCAKSQATIADLEAALDRGAMPVEASEQETFNAVVVRLKDAWWAVERDRLGSARSIAALAPRGLDLSGAALEGLWAIEVALAGIDRLEVRGRDSAGIHVLVAGHGLDPADPEVASLLGARVEDDLFTSFAARVPEGCLSLVYKAAAEIGELGDNVAALRAAVRSDPLLALVLAQPDSRVTVTAHTRWASVGIISEANAHPINSEELDDGTGAARPYVTASLNGDVDNYLHLRFSEALRLPEEVTTDAKVIPALVSHRLAEGVPMDEAFASTVARFEGSVAIAVSAAVSPDQLHLALRGSGQGMCIGLTEDAYVVASEPYGLVEQTARFVRLEGEVTGGQTAVLDRSAAGTLEGITIRRYGGAPVAVDQRAVQVAQVTTRDIDRASFPHFLLKELNESPGSFRKTLRGRIVEGPDGVLVARLGEDALPPALVDAWTSGRIRSVLVIGQGTAAVAGQAAAAAFARCVGGIPVHALPATELSGFGLSDDMSDTLIVAISQSGTTTDTNRTVDLARNRGAHVVAVVNRRSSDLVGKSHGVLYTSDGRDIEMSVASTKAFYAQVAAGWLLAAALGALPRPGQVPGERAAVIGDALATLRDLPRSMERVLAERPLIGRAAGRWAPARRYWAIVGSGPDRVAATEVRIKLSELCYKAIAADVIEDKKHIDLSSEPLILVCAAALSGPTAADVAKEVAIYRAHKAAPVVVARRSEAERFANALEVVPVDDIHPDLSFVLSAMVGHLFGYEAALAIDALALPLRAARAGIEAVTGGELTHEPEMLERLTTEVGLAAQPFVDGVRTGDYNGTLEASTAVSLTTLLRYASGLLPLETYELESGKVGTPTAVITDLLAALTTGIDELTRPIDAIKHQAKTVTVGISRSEEELLELPLVKHTLAAGASPDRLGYRALRTLGALDRAVEEITGFTRYRITEPTPGGAPAQEVPTISVVEQGGVAAEIPSRTRTDRRLRGTKHRAADEREVTVARGRRDGRTVILVPEVEANTVVGMTLLHVRFADVLTPADAKAVLSGYRGRYSALADAITETEPAVDDEVLGQVPIVDLLTEPVYVLAERWRSHP